jgi:WD40 repeat protein
VRQVAKEITQIKEKWDAWSVTFSADGTRLAASSPNSDEVHVWAWQEKPHTVHVLQMSKGGNIDGLRYSPDGRFLTAAHGKAEENRIVRIWDSQTGTIVGDIAESRSGSSALERAGLGFSPDGRWLVRSQAGGWYAEGSEKVFVDSFIVHDTISWQRSWGLHTEPFEPSTLEISPDGSMVSLAGWRLVPVEGAKWATNISRPAVTLLDLNKRVLVRSFEILEDNCEAIAFVAWHTDGRRLAVGGACNSERMDAPAGQRRIKGAAVEVFDVITGKRTGEWVRQTSGHVNALKYSPDGKRLVIGWDRELEIWDSEHSILLQVIPADVSAAAFSRDSRYLAIATTDAGISVWKID